MVRSFLRRRAVDDYRSVNGEENGELYILAVHMIRCLKRVKFVPLLYLIA